MKKYISSLISYQNWNHCICQYCSKIVASEGEPFFTLSRWGEGEKTNNNQTGATAPYFLASVIDVIFHYLLVTLLNYEDLATRLVVEYWAFNVSISA